MSVYKVISRRIIKHLEMILESFMMMLGFASFCAISIEEEKSVEVYFSLFTLSLSLALLF
jgi:hypothetical protein